MTSPMKGGRRSISTFSVTTKRLLRCFRGGLPTMGIVSLGPARRRFKVVALGGVAFTWSEVEGLSRAPLGWLARVDASEGVSELTTTIGGVGPPSEEDLRSDVAIPDEIGEEDLWDEEGLCDALCEEMTLD